MRKTLTGCLIASALASINPAYAQIFTFSFTDTNQTERNIKPSTQTFLNPVGVLNLNLISGLDRYERVKVIRDSDQSIMHTAMTPLIGVSDRIVASDGSEYYGKNMALPALGEGGYTIVDETLDIHQAVVSTTTYKLLIDSTKPAYKSLYATPGVGMIVTGDAWELGRGTTGQYNIYLDGVTDSSGIDSVRMQIKRANGDIVSDQALNYDMDSQRAFYTWAVNEQSSSSMPTSDLNETFTFNFVIKDKAGNINALPAQPFKYDDQVGEFTVFAVHDSRSSTSNVPGISSGYVPYKPGLSVIENPYRVVIRIPKTNWQEYRNGGISVVNSYGGNTIIASDSTYIYLEAKLPQGALDVNYFRPVNTYQWAGANLTFIGDQLSWDPASVKSPVWTKIERQKADGTWVNSVDFTWLTAADLPLTYTALRFTVEARPYPQTIVGAQACEIPAGTTSCTISVSATLPQGTSGYMHDGYAITSSQEKAFNTPIWENITWHALTPSVTGYQYNESTSLLDVFVNVPGDGSYFDNVRMSKVWLSDKDAANKEIISGAQTSRNVSSGNYTYQFDMKTIPEGSYNLQINAVDTYKNTGSLAFKQFIVDRTPPLVDVIYEGKPVDKSVTVMGLENLRIHLSDALTTPKISRMTLRGGPVSDAVELSWVDLGKNVYSPNYPKIFPSLNDDETYTMTVQATDEMNNTTASSVEFKYLPNNLVRMENLKTIAVNAALKTSDDIPLAVLYASQLRKKDGSIATGPQDAVLTVRKDAKFGVTVNGVSAEPGESKNVKLDLGLGDSRSFPIFPSVSGVTGSSEFMLNIDELK